MRAPLLEPEKLVASDSCQLAQHGVESRAQPQPPTIDQRLAEQRVTTTVCVALGRLVWLLSMKRGRAPPPLPAPTQSATMECSNPNSEDGDGPMYVLDWFADGWGLDSNSRNCPTAIPGP